MASVVKTYDGGEIRDYFVPICKRIVNFGTYSKKYFEFICPRPLRGTHYILRAAVADAPSLVLLSPCTVHLTGLLELPHRLVVKKLKFKTLVVLRICSSFLLDLFKC